MVTNGPEGVLGLELVVFYAWDFAPDDGLGWWVTFSFRSAQSY